MHYRAPEGRHIITRAASAHGIEHANLSFCLPPPESSRKPAGLNVNNPTGLQAISSMVGKARNANAFLFVF
ncbi:MAG: hypothetical protein LUG18_15995 [Candidatus Azobacteroides sp.]|nr:hypothetical protein [Candidatus Azobacteroides sp.]